MTHTTENLTLREIEPKLAYFLRVPIEVYFEKNEWFLFLAKGKKQ